MPIQKVLVVDDSKTELMFMTDLPEKIFFPIWAIIKLSTPFWSAIFFLLVKIMAPSYWCLTHSPRQIGFPFGCVRYVATLGF